MRIDNWPLDRIMRLPDWCFGRRWWVGEYMTEVEGGTFYRLGSENLPDKFVVWGVLVSSMCDNAIGALALSIRLGDHEPADLNDLVTMEILLKGISTPAHFTELYVNPNGVEWINCERLIVESAGRRLALCTIGEAAKLYHMTVGVLISSMPKEVPDWLFSGPDKRL